MATLYEFKANRRDIVQLPAQGQQIKQDKQRTVTA
jgi:hypothetical protein